MMTFACFLPFFLVVVFPVSLPASGTAIEIRYADACCRGSSRAPKLVICIFGRFSYLSMGSVA